MTPNDMATLTSKAESLVDAIGDTILSTVEIAAERVSLAGDLTRATQRMAAFVAVLEAISAQKQALAARAADAEGAMKVLCEQQILVLAAREADVLERAGASPEAARAAIAVDDPGGSPSVRDRARRRPRLTGAAG